MARIKPMGQYYKNRKIGTCERMYYMRLDEAIKLAKQGASDDDGIKFNEYLTDNITAFRFPFPDEDNGIVEHDAGLNPFKGFNIPTGGIEVEHGTICLSQKEVHGIAHFNIMLPCPYSQAFKDAGLKTSTGGAGEPKLSVLFEGMRDGKRKTIFGCAQCEAQQRFSNDDIVKIKERAMEYFEPYNRIGKNEAYGGNQGLYDYVVKVIERIN